MRTRPADARAARTVRQHNLSSGAERKRGTGWIARFSRFDLARGYREARGSGNAKTTEGRRLQHGGYRIHQRRTLLSTLCERTQRQFPDVRAAGGRGGAFAGGAGRYRAGPGGEAAYGFPPRTHTESPVAPQAGAGIGKGHTSTPPTAPPRTPPSCLK